VLIDDLIDEAIQRAASPSKARVEPLRVHAPEVGYKICDVESAKEFRKLLQNPNELVLPLLRVRPKGRAVDDVFRQVEHELADVDGFSGGGRDGADCNVDLVTHGLPGLGALAAEEFHDAELAHLAPEGAVVCEGHIGAVVGEVADGDGGGAVGEDVVMDLENLTRRLRVGDGDHVEEAHAEVENAAVLLGEGGETAVG